MPGTTPNRGYPFPVNSDALNVAVDIEKLARAIDVDFSNIAAPEALSIRPWTADATWGSLAHPAMLGTEAILISRPVQPTIVTSWNGQPVQLRMGPTDGNHQLQVGLDHRFTGGSVLQLTPNSSFLVPAGSNSQFGDINGQAFFRPLDAASNTHIQNVTGGHIYFNATAIHFRDTDGAPDMMQIYPTGGVNINGVLTASETIGWPSGAGLYSVDPGWVRTSTGVGIGAARADLHLNGSDVWNGQQLVIQADQSHAGIGFAVHQASWAVILRANPQSSLAPCLDVMLSDTSAYARLAAESFNVISSERFKDNVTQVTDEDLLARVVQVQAVTWETPPRMGTDGQPIITPNVDSLNMGVTAEALIVPFPELVNLDDQSLPLTVEAAHTAATALAAVGALARKVQALEARVPA